MIIRLATLVAVLGTSCFAAPIQMWVDDSAGEIGTVNVTTGAVTLVGNAGVTLTDIAFAPNGNLYGISFSNLYKINTTTGAASLVGSLGAANDGTANALVFSSTGILYTANDHNLLTINTSTGAATLVGALGTGIGSAGDLAFVGGQLFLSDTGNHLDKVNTTTGGATQVGSTGVVNLFGLATPDNVTLYGVASTNLYTINTTTGAATLDVSYAGHGLGAANGESFITEATNATPEPSTLLLVGCGLLAATMIRRRKA
jgi:hypothetical protein